MSPAMQQKKQRTGAIGISLVLALGSMAVAAMHIGSDAVRVGFDNQRGSAEGDVAKPSSSIRSTTSTRALARDSARPRDGAARSPTASPESVTSLVPGAVGRIEWIADSTKPEAARLRQFFPRAQLALDLTLESRGMPLRAIRQAWVGNPGVTQLASRPDLPGDAAAPTIVDPVERSAESSARPSLVRLKIDLSGVNTSSTTYTRFKSWVDSAAAGNPGYDFHAGDAAIMFLIRREVRYCTLAVGMIEEQVSDAESAIAGGSSPAIAGDSYLEVGPMLSDLSLTYHACAGSISSAQRQRWSAYAEQAVWNVWNPSGASWGGRSAPWSGWSIDNPGNNYHYSFIEATMSWALASGSPTWLNLLRDSKLPALQAYYATIPGGGSQEGTGYGTAQMRLFDIYGLWRKSAGVDLSLANTHARNTIDYWVHATVPSLDRFAPIGDQSRNSVPELYDYHRHLVLAARYLTFDTTARNTATWWLRNISVEQMGQGANMRYDALLPAGSGGAPPSRRYYVAKGTGHVFARSGWDTNAMWMAFVGGPYRESHAHQDQGSFTLFSRGDWMAVTENIWSHSGIQQGTEVHNVLRFERNGGIVSQREGTTSTATVTPGANGALAISANLTPAYRGDTAVGSWRRQLDFANRRLLVRDNFSLGSGASAIFQLNVPVQPVLVDSRTVTAGRMRMRVLQPANPSISLRNWNASDPGEFNRGWRIDVRGGSSVYQVELTEL